MLEVFEMLAEEAHVDAVPVPHKISYDGHAPRWRQETRVGPDILQRGHGTAIIANVYGTVHSDLFGGIYKPELLTFILFRISFALRQF